MIKNTIKATPNYSKRTFTIRKYWEDGVTSKYKTVQLSKDEFNEMEYYTSNDWIYFLRTDNGVYIKINNNYKT